MSPFLAETHYPGATTCIIIGGLTGIAADHFKSYRRIQWWHDLSDAGPLPPVAVESIPLEKTGSETELTARLESFFRLDPRHLPSLLVTASVATCSTPVYENAITVVHAALESAHRARLTRQKDGFIWQKHVLKNVPIYLKNRLPAAWNGALRGLPAIVCGAGPSLDRSIAKLAAAAERAVIFAADSALRALDRHGVPADFAVSIDAAKTPDKCLPATHPPARLVLASTSPPAWQSAWPHGHTFFLSGAQITDDWLATQGVARTPLAAVESCGSTAIELAYFLGCDPIYLFGLDLAVDPANPARRHQQDADPGLYTRSNYDPTAALPRVPGNYVATVPCFALGDWRSLDARLASRPESHVVNVTDRGARLRGTLVVHPDAFSLDANLAAKHARLALLTNLPSSANSSNATVQARLRVVGARGQTAVPELSLALARGGPAALSAGFRSLVLDPEFGRVFGSFTLKLMPHLVPPIEGDTAFWQNLLTEFTELCEHVQTSAELVSDVC